MNLTKGLIETSGWSYDEAVLAADSLDGRKPENVISCVHGETPKAITAHLLTMSARCSRTDHVLCLGFLAISLKKLIPMRCSISQATSVMRTRLELLSFEADEYTLRDQYRPVSHQNGNNVPLPVRSASLGPAVRNNYDWLFDAGPREVHPSDPATRPNAS